LAIAQTNAERQNCGEASAPLTLINGPTIEACQRLHVAGHRRGFSEIADPRPAIKL
jgi:hypothetical protein